MPLHFNNLQPLLLQLNHLLLLSIMILNVLDKYIIVLGHQSGTMTFDICHQRLVVGLQLILETFHVCKLLFCCRWLDALSQV